MIWNVFGGGKAELIARAAQALEADIFVIIGCAPGRAGPLAKALGLIGLPNLQGGAPVGRLLDDDRREGTD